MAASLNMLLIEKSCLEYYNMVLRKKSEFLKIVKEHNENVPKSIQPLTALIVNFAKKMSLIYC